MKKTILKIKGMTCASCAAGLVSSFKNTPNIQSADVNFATSKATIIHDEKVTISALEKIVIKSGFQINKEQNRELADKQHEKLLFIKTIISIPLTLSLFIRMFFPWQIPGELFGLSNTLLLQMLLSAIVVFIMGFEFHKRAAIQATRFRADMDALISIGTLSAFFFSVWAMLNDRSLYFDSAATITTLILLGRYMEAKTKGKASMAMQKLLEMGAKQATIIDANEQETLVDLDEIKINDIALIKTGEKIPLDGVIIDGTVSIDESMLTGESMPVDKKIGNKVFGATIIQSGIMKIKITSTSTETMLAQIIRTVEDAQNFKPPLQRLADKIASVFVPAVIFISVSVFMSWYLTTGNLALSLINAISVLIISCPCPLGIATPIAVMVGTSVGAKSGILIKSGEIFEKIKNINTIVFDKTGTLTEGKPQVSNIIPNYGFSEEKIIKLATSIAKNSNHPLSIAVTKYGQDKKINQENIENFLELPGMGMTGKIKDKKIMLGNIKLLATNNIDANWAEEIQNKNTSGGTIIFLSEAGQIAGGIVINDQIKSSAKQTIEIAKKMGLEVIMLSGDHKSAAKAVAEQIGINNVIAGVLPSEKQSIIIKLQSENKKVVFVGDGINDAPALVQSDLGIAMGLGTDVAKEAGDIIITSNDILKVVEAVKLSSKTFRIIKQNLFWAFFYNVLAIPLASLGFVTPMIAALAMACSDVTVVANSLRIYKK